MSDHLEQMSREQLIETNHALRTKLEYLQEEQAQHEKLDYSLGNSFTIPEKADQAPREHRGPPFIYV